VPSDGGFFRANEGVAFRHLCFVFAFPVDAMSPSRAMRTCTCPCLARRGGLCFARLSATLKSYCFFGGYVASPPALRAQALAGGFSVFASLDLPSELRSSVHRALRRIQLNAWPCLLGLSSSCLCRQGASLGLRLSRPCGLGSGGRRNHNSTQCVVVAGLRRGGDTAPYRPTARTEVRSEKGQTRLSR